MPLPRLWFGQTPSEPLGVSLALMRVSGLGSNCLCREGHDPMDEPPGQCKDSPGDKQKVALVSVVPDQMHFEEFLWLCCPGCFPSCLSFSHPLDPQCHDKEQVSMGDVPLAPQDLRNGSLCCSHFCPPAPNLGNPFRPRSWVSNPLTVRQASTKGLKSSHSERLFDPTITEERGPTSPWAQAALWTPLNTLIRTKSMDFFILQVINWAASPEPLLLLPGHISEFNLRANEANYQQQTWSPSNYFPWKGHPKWHIVKPS